MPLASRRTEILAAARRLLEAEGEQALTMRRLAAGVGMRAPSLYKHFPDKAALEEALAATALTELATLVSSFGSPVTMRSSWPVCPSGASCPSSWST